MLSVGALNSKTYISSSRRGIEIKKYPAIFITYGNSRLRWSLVLRVGGCNRRRQALGRPKREADKWYEVQDNIAYWEEFEQPKIIVPAITDTVNFAPDMRGYYCNNKATIFVQSRYFSLALLPILRSRRGMQRRRLPRNEAARL